MESTPFTIIPVLDLKGGQVVHARAGDRANYRPIRTPLAATSAAEDVLAGLLGLAPLREVYIADLDAIEGSGDHRSLAATLQARSSAVQFWLDKGCRSVAEARRLAEAGLIPVIGSESLDDASVPRQLNAALGPDCYILSLDHRGASFLGPPELATSAEDWPGRVIVMTLDRVGAGDGPDFGRLAAIAQRAAARRVYAAGGVRGRDDVAELGRLGIAGALVASALHDGRLLPRDL